MRVCVGVREIDGPAEHNVAKMVDSFGRSQAGPHSASNDGAVNNNIEAGRAGWLGEVQDETGE
jgi:hypothetical protein